MKKVKTLGTTSVIKPHKPPGPEPVRVKIDGDWGDAVKTALAKKRPAEGWPEPKKTGKRP